jgi:3-oxoacyl-[acyl-carrier protein] reductase/meso-butanediol dehydrogenase/(S,S)-butanediol dehydrogenase/diacetyl reductase
MRVLEGKSVVVTGGTRGIGLAIVRACLDAGARVIVGARTPTEALATLGVELVPTDVRVAEQVHALASHAATAHGGLDAWINNAGVSVWRTLDRLDEAIVRTLVDTNLLGTMWGCQAAARHLGPGGAIVNVASLAGRRGSPNNSAYCASKFGVIGVTQSLALELGPRGIRVNAVCPVYVATDTLVSNLGGDHPDRPGADPRGFLDQFARTRTALGRLPTEDDVARACVHLASDGASAITGQGLHVDCGAMPL